VLHSEFSGQPGLYSETVSKRKKKGGEGVGEVVWDWIGSSVVESLSSMCKASNGWVESEKAKTRQEFLYPSEGFSYILSQNLPKEGGGILIPFYRQGDRLREMK
jgi:hypothetical protein